MHWGDLNAPRWPRAEALAFPAHQPFHEVWYVVASDPRAGRGLWVRCTLDANDQGERAFALWAAWFEGGSAFALRAPVSDAAISRTSADFGAVEGGGDGCAGEVEAGGRSLRWRLKFGQGPAGEDLVPVWLQPVARLRESGLVLPRPATTVSGAVEVDGKLHELARVPAGQAHLWGKERYASWSWARCSAFAEDPDASLDLLDVEGPGGVRVPIFVLRHQGKTHRFAELPWIALARSSPAAPSWHFSAQNATHAIDGVVRARPEQMVQVQYDDPKRPPLHCVNTELAQVELRIRTRALPALAWRPEAVLTSSAASLEFTGPTADPRVTNLLVSQR